MWTLFKEGGFPMWVVLAFGFTTIATAFAFAVRPSARHVRFIKSMNAATLFAAFGGVLMDFSTVAHVVGNREDMAAELRTRIVLMGFGESMAPGIMGLTFAALVAMLLAVGQRRLDAREE